MRDWTRLEGGSSVDLIGLPQALGGVDRAVSRSLKAVSAMAIISVSLRSWMGCLVSTAAASKPSDDDWACTADAKWTVETNTPGVPRRSMSLMSCTLHDTQEPQSASASITASQLLAISWRRSTGAGLVNVGFM